MNTSDAARFPAESLGLLSCRLLLGDEMTAEIVFDQPYDEGFVRRHRHQLGGLLESYLEAQAAE